MVIKEVKRAGGCMRVITLLDDSQEEFDLKLEKFKADLQDDMIVDAPAPPAAVGVGLAGMFGGV
jgi:hypothetical protein